MVVATSKGCTPAAYLQQEEQAESKSELIAGEIVPMAGASANHNVLAGKFYARLLLALEDEDAFVFMSDMRLWIPAHESYTYPDVMTGKGTPNYTDRKQTAITNPCLIVEVLSVSTERYDKSGKFYLYRSIPESEEYVLIDQTAYRVEQYTRQGDRQWLLTEWFGEEAVVPLRSLGGAIALKDLYKRVAFDTEAIAQNPASKEEL
ncbi:MAG: Uma2 family endonuclease [Coleofasciculaceae cyanobacterium SM2_3_26]|nr:Uma2 family endonuclease [Coleofasciculaceae cyanobacterium SM2_3_26]